MEEERTFQFLCIGCPEGCEMDVIEDPSGVLHFPDHICRIGQEYARKEIYNPVRYLTTTVEVQGASILQLPVRTNAPIPRGKIEDAMTEIAMCRVSAPVCLGQTIMENLVGTGTALIASRSVVPGQPEWA